jgi:hypothetical protein
VRRQELRGNRSSARGSFDGLQKAVYLLSLLAHESGLTLAQMVVPNGGEEKTNERKAALRLLEGLVLEGRLVTGDAMFCQRDFCQQVIDARGGVSAPSPNNRYGADESGTVPAYITAAS